MQLINKEKIMTEAMFDLLWIIDNVITIALKLLIIVIAIKLIRNKKKCFKEITG